MRNITAAAVAALAAAALTGGLATSALAATAPTIKITGASVSTQPGYYPTPAGPVIQAQATARFDSHGVKVTDILLLVDGRPVPDNSTGAVTTYFGKLTWGTGTQIDYESIPGTGFKVSPGRHALVNEIIGVNGKVLAKSPSFTVTVPKQTAAVQPKLAYTLTQQGDNYGYFEITAPSPTVLDAPTYVLNFDLPAGQTMTADSNGGSFTQSGTRVTFTSGAGDQVGLSPQGSFRFYFSTSGPAFGPVSNVTIDGIPVSH